MSKTKVKTLSSSVSSTEAVRKVIYAIAEECKLIVKHVLSNQGYNDKVRKDTLSDSNLYNSIDVRYNGVDLIEFFAPEYIKYVESGRQPYPIKEKEGRNGKYIKVSFPPPEVISEWAGRKGLPTDNQTIFLICRSIVEKGIKPRPIFSKEGDFWTKPLSDTLLVEEMIDEYWDSWADEIFEAATTDLDNEFND